MFAEGVPREGAEGDGADSVSEQVPRTQKQAVQEQVVGAARLQWPLLFSRLFEVTTFSGAGRCGRGLGRCGGGRGQVRAGCGRGAGGCGRGAGRCGRTLPQARERHTRLRQAPGCPGLGWSWL